MQVVLRRAAKLSVSVPNDLAKAVRKKVGPRGLSGFVARAMQHELEREQLASYLSEMDEAIGPVPAKTLALARAAWPRR
jgi:post-segregation antitoxin (ccd killing protein)